MPPTTPVTDYFNTGDPQGERQFRQELYNCMRTLTNAIRNSSNGYWDSPYWSNCNSQTTRVKVILEAVANSNGSVPEQSVLRNYGFTRNPEMCSSNRNLLNSLTNYGFTQRDIDVLHNNRAMLNMMLQVVTVAHQKQTDIAQLHDQPGHWDYWCARMYADDARELMAVAAAYRNAPNNSLPPGPAGEIFTQIVNAARRDNDTRLCPARGGTQEGGGLHTDSVSGMATGRQDYAGRPADMVRDSHIIFQQLSRHMTSDRSTTIEHFSAQADGVDYNGQRTVETTQCLSRENLQTFGGIMRDLASLQGQLRQLRAATPPDQAAINRVSGQIRSKAQSLKTECGPMDDNFLRALMGMNGTDSLETGEIRGNEALVNLAAGIAEGLESNFNEACQARTGDRIATERGISRNDLLDISMGYHAQILGEGNPMPGYLSAQGTQVATRLYTTINQNSSSSESGGLGSTFTSGPPGPQPGNGNNPTRTGQTPAPYQPTGGNIMTLPDPNPLRMGNNGHILGGFDSSPGSLSISLSSTSSYDSSNYYYGTGGATNLYSVGHNQPLRISFN